MSGYPGEGGPSLDQEEWLASRDVNPARTTGPTYPTRTGAHVYGAGDRDPTVIVLGTLCDAPSPDGYVCTWHAGHTHPQHVAGLAGRVAAVWPVKP